MAHSVEPMDVDIMDSDNKENSYQHSNVLPCTEKGYEELDVSELNMKLRYSITPASSPMSKSYTACLEHRNPDPDIILNYSNENDSLTRSLNSTMNKNDNVIKLLKSLPLQSIPKEKFIDGNCNPSVLRQLDSATSAIDNTNEAITVTGANDIDENLSLPSSSSSALHTPEATTPTKEISKSEEGSPIIRGLKTVFNMFRSSQSPIPSADTDTASIKQEIIGPVEKLKTESKHQAMASTPISAKHTKDNASKRSSPYKDCIVFNDDLETELQWKDETTILFSDEKIPIPKLFFQHVSPHDKSKTQNVLQKPKEENFNSTLEHMDISYNDSILKDKTVTDIQIESNKILTNAIESDGEFLDCETTFTNNDSVLVHSDKKIENEAQIPTENNLITHENIPLPTESFNLLAANMSLPDAECRQEKNYNPADFTQETSEILNEISKIEENKSSYFINKSNFKEHTNIVQPSNPNEMDENVSPTTDPDETFYADVDTEKTDELTPKGQCNKENIETQMKNTITVPETNITLEKSQNVCTNTILHNIEIDNKLSEIIHVTMNSTCVPQVEEYKLDKNVTEEELLPSEWSGQFVPDIPFTKGTNNPHEAYILCHQSPSDTPLPDEDDIIYSVLPIDKTSDETPLPQTNEMHPDHLSTQLQLNNSQPSILLSTQNDGNTGDKALLSVIDDGISADTTSAENTISQQIACDIHDQISLHSAKKEEIDSVVTLDTTPFIALNKVDETVSDFCVQNNTQDMINMDISLNQTHDLPDLVNETIAGTKEFVEDLEKENETMAVAKEFVENIEKENDTISVAKEFVENIEKENETIAVAKEIEENIEKKIECMIIPVQENQLASSEYLKTSDCKESTTITKLDDDLKNKSYDGQCKILKEESLNLHPTLINRFYDHKTETVTPNVTESINVNITTEIITPNSVSIEDEKPVIVQQNNHIDEHSVAVPIDIPSNNRNSELSANADDDVLIVSENNSPYVSLAAEVGSGLESKPIDEHYEEDENVITNFPSSPPIISRGYNFNFDDIDDTFTIPKQIKTSPPPMATAEMKQDTYKFKEFKLTNKEIPHRRKSQPPERRKPTVIKKNFNSTINADNLYETNATVFTLSQTMKEDLPIDNETSFVLEDGTREIVTELAISAPNFHDGSKLITKNINAELSNDNNCCGLILPKQEQINLCEENKTSIDSVTAVSNDIETTSSSEQSAYYSAEASSSGSIQSKNVFNLPEIDDSNFNPFATISKMRQSPPPCMEDKNLFITSADIQTSPGSSVTVNFNIKKDDNKTLKLENDEKVETYDKMETELMEKDTSVNTTTTTTSSKATDHGNVTTHEVHTEDEDTIEGPFLDTDVIEKMNEFGNDGVDMMQFNDAPVKTSNNNEDNLDGGEIFIDAEAFEFLLNKNQAKSNTVADSGRESLFLKFDPLFAKRMSSDGMLATLNKIQKRQSTPTKPIRPSLKNEVSPIAGPSNLNITYEGDVNTSQDSNDELNITVSKPMMVVNPAVNPAVTPRNKSITPTRSNRRSITFTSPAIAVIDRLLSLSSNNSHLQDTTVSYGHLEQNDADLTQLRELLAEKEINLCSLRSESKDLKERLVTMEAQVRTLEADAQDRLKKINKLNECLAEKTKTNKSMAAVVEEYERTIASLIAETEQDKKLHAEERIRLINERDEQTAHLASMEVSFSDLHSKYEKSKQVILSCKANEETYKKSIKDFEQNFDKMQKNYELLKQHATSKLNHANQELEKINRSHEAEVVKLNAMIKRKDLHITSLEETLTQKTKANEELTAICDELINKVG